MSVRKVKPCTNSKQISTFRPDSRVFVFLHKIVNEDKPRISILIRSSTVLQREPTVQTTLVSRESRKGDVREYTTDVQIRDCNADG